MEVLGSQILDSLQKKEWKAIKVSPGGPSLPHLSFADDLFLFGKAIESQTETMENFLRQFCVISMQKVNIGKSKLHVEVWNWQLVMKGDTFNGGFLEILRFPNYSWPHNAENISRYGH